MAKDYRFVRFLVSLGVLLSTLAWVGTRVSAAPATVTWPSSANLSNTPEKSVFPAVAYDAAGAMHVAWEELGERSSRVYYTNNVSGAFRSPLEVSNAGARTASSAVALVVENGRVHILFVGDDQRIRHQILTLDGGRPARGAAATISQAKATNPTAVVDASGRVHAAWIDNHSGVYQVYHRIWANGGWEGSERAVRPTGQYQSTPDLAATNNGQVHIIFANNRSLGYSIFNGSAWQDAPDPGPGPTYQQALASDGTNIFAVWSRTTHEVFFARLVNGGWSSPVALGPSNTRNDFPSIAYSAANGRIYAAWSIADQGIGVREITREGGLSDLQILRGTPSAWPQVAAGGDRISVVWQQRVGGAEDILLVTAAANGSPPPATPPTPVPPTATPLPAPATGTFDFASSAFRDLWTRTDSLVLRRSVSYSWIWGPSAFTSGVNEYYVQSPGQARLVQYFDKSRMEINQPDAPRGPFYVTNGRLVDELITGLMQTGDAQYEQRSAAHIAVAGDPQNTFPQYFDLQAVYRKQRAGDRANEILFRASDGSIKTDLLPNANDDPSMIVAQRIAGLGIPKVFWDFMNRPGQVVENGTVVGANPLIDWRYVIGEPLTEAYWTVIKVNGVDRGVLMQAFERRVLTYTPTNAPEFQVEMGNVGRHYFEWRYGVRP